MTLIAHPSPNFGPRIGCAAPDMIILHYTGMDTAEAALARLCDPGPEVSSHYLIAEDGRVFQLVDDTQRAWHAGVSYWQGARDINSRSIGIELANPGPLENCPPFPEPQMAALAGLVAGLQSRWSIPAARVVGHADVAPGRKADPGAKLDWARLGLELTLKVQGDLDQQLVDLGYDPDATPQARAAAAADRFAIIDAAQVRD